MALDGTWDAKDPNDVKDYKLDWGGSADKKAFGDTLTASAWTITPVGLTKDSDTFNGTSTTIWLSGGSAGQTYVLTNHVTTAGGRQYDQSVKLKCKEA